MNVLGLVGRAPYTLTAFGVLLFFVYAINFLYFFVDDEAITMVYAQNLLRGRGLTYSDVEGTTEGYSNFLHVWIGALLIWVTDLADLPKAAVFAFGRAFSLFCGAAIVAIVARLLQRLVSDDAWAQAAALSFLALAGPLAVWSCSALETVPSAAAFTGFAAILLVGELRRIWPAAALGIAVLLFRLDGFLGVGLALAAAFVAAPGRRQELLKIGTILAAVFVVYNAWRWWYFGSLLSLPLQTKVLFKLLPAEGVVTRLPQAGYLERFLEAYHVVPLLLVSLGWLPFWRPGDDRSPFAFLLIVVGWSAYAAVIGDWMFGFRFFVIIFPALAILAGFSLGRVRRHAPRLAIPAAIVLIAWSAWSSERFIVAFEQSDRLARWQRWWRDPSFEPKRYFEPYRFDVP